MIVWDSVNGNYKRNTSARPFPTTVQNVARNYASFLSSIPNIMSPQDLVASRSTAGMDLCHHISFYDIENIVVDFLNNKLSLNQFMILIGSISRPSWSNLSFPPTLMLLAAQWGLGIKQRFEVIFSHYSNRNPTNTATAANRLVETLNYTITNLRYGHASTNRSIGNHLDLRMHRGPSLDPIMIVNILIAWSCGRPGAYSAESSAMLNDWEVYAKKGRPLTSAGHQKMSEGGAILYRTKKGNPVYGTTTPLLQDKLLRGSFRLWTPVSIDTLIYIIAAFILSQFLMVNIIE